MGLLTNSRSRTALGGSLGTKRTLGGYKLSNKAELAERAQSNVAKTASAMTKKGSKTETKSSDVAKATAAISVATLGAKVYEVANTPADFKDMDAVQQQSHLDSLSSEGQEMLQDKQGQHFKAGVGEPSADNLVTQAQTNIKTGGASVETPTADLEGSLATEASGGGVSGSTDTGVGMSEGVEQLNTAEAIATGVDSVEAVESAVDTTQAIGAALEGAETASTALDTTAAFSFFG